MLFMILGKLLGLLCYLIFFKVLYLCIEILSKGKYTRLWLVIMWLGIFRSFLYR